MFPVMSVGESYVTSVALVPPLCWDRLPPAGLEPASFGLEVRSLVHEAKGAKLVWHSQKRWGSNWLALIRGLLGWIWIVGCDTYDQTLCCSIHISFLLGEPVCLMFGFDCQLLK